MFYEQKTQIGRFTPQQQPKHSYCHSGNCLKAQMILTSKKNIQALQTQNYLEFFSQIITPLSALFKRNYEKLITYQVPMPTHHSFYYYRIDRSQQPTNIHVSRSFPKKISFFRQSSTLILNTLLLNE
jgi:hypothetical protein